MAGSLLKDSASAWANGRDEINIFRDIIFNPNPTSAWSMVLVLWLLCLTWWGMGELGQIDIGRRGVRVEDERILHTFVHTRLYRGQLSSGGVSPGSSLLHRKLRQYAGQLNSQSLRTLSFCVLICKKGPKAPWLILRIRHQQGVVRTHM